MIFEDNLLPLKNLRDTEKIETHFVCVINTSISFDVESLINKMREMNIPCIENHREITSILIKNISSSRGRLCRWLSGFENAIFFKDAFMIISYFTYQEKKYINGFAKVKIIDEETMEITYICSDLKFSGIGKILISLIKLSITLLKIPLIILESVNRGTTQNFYTSQGFQYLRDNKDKKVFQLNTLHLSQKDQIIIDNLYKKLNEETPFLITYEPSKFDKNKETIDPTELIPYNRIRTAESPRPFPIHFMDPRIEEEEEEKEDEEDVSGTWKEVSSPRGGKKTKKQRKTKKKKRKQKKQQRKTRK
jgi:hypothetical protein